MLDKRNQPKYRIQSMESLQASMIITHGHPLKIALGVLMLVVILALALYSLIMIHIHL
jgi:hypothetical protein